MDILYKIMTNARFFVLIFFCIIMSSCSYELGMSVKYLKDNQQGHITIYGSAVDTFLCSVYSCEEEPSSENIKKAWKNVADGDMKINIKDEKSINSMFLIKNASKALETWNNSKWKADVSFDDFCKYILPYRVKTEIVKDGWRDTLYSRYSHLIENVYDLTEAFKIVHDTIQQTFHQTNISIPYILSAIDLDNIKYGNCTQRCVYEASVMRALGIPVAVDEISEWANYGTSGHSWVSLIYRNQTLTMSRETKELKRHNPIDASIFSLKMPLEDGYVSTLNEILSFKKTVSRVWRNSYENAKSNYDDNQADNETRLRFNNPFMEDVSKEYFATNDIVFNSKDKYGYLCTFRTGQDWHPVVFSQNNKGRHVFKNMGDSVVYQYVTFKHGKMQYKGNPFLFANGKKQEINPSARKTNLILNRKYPMITQFVNYWIRVRNAYFAASNDSAFKDSTLLYEIGSTPLFKNHIAVKKVKNKYRYYRYGTFNGTKHNISEIWFYNNNNPIKGKVVGSYNVEDPQKGFDDDTFSYFEGKNPFWITIDMGTPVAIDSIVYFTRNDNNYVLPNDDYELLYFDKGWHSMGTIHSNAYSVEFENVPQNALYLLKNKSRGKEERVFTVVNNKQIWW